MQPNQKSAFFSSVVWGLLSLWLFFGGLAYAEQVSLLAETNDQDEEVLSALGSVTKPDDSSVEGRSTTNSVNILVTGVPLLLEKTNGSFSATHGLHDHSTLRLHQRVSVYRI